MWPIGHVAIAYICYTSSTRLRLDSAPSAGATLVLVFGSLFPDLVDKPFAWYIPLLPTGRTLAHSLLFLVPLVVLVFALARHRGVGEYGVAFGLGALSHTLIDAAPTLWRSEADWGFLFWPVVPVSGYEEGAPSIVVLFQNSLTEPYFLLEFFLFGIAFVLWRADGYPGLELISDRDEPTDPG